LWVWGGNGGGWASARPADGGDLHHIMNAHSRQPVRGVAALWTVAASALEADALSTALFFVTPQKLQAVYNFEYAILRDSPHGLQLERSAAFPAEFFTT
jgi:thiamine biosynthesis lipoprotein